MPTPSPATAPTPAPADLIAELTKLLEAESQKVSAGGTIPVADAPSDVLWGTLVNRGMTRAGRGAGKIGGILTSPWTGWIAAILAVLALLGIVPNPFPTPRPPTPVPVPTPPGPTPTPTPPSPQPQPNPTPPPIVLNSPVALATKAMLADQARAYRAVKAKLQAGSIQKSGLAQALLTEKTPLAQSLADQINAAPDTAGALEDVAKVFEGAKIP